MAHLLYDAVEIGFEGLPVSRQLGMAPHVVGLGGQAGEGGLDLGRHVHQARAVALQDAHLGSLDRAEQRLGGRETVEAAAAFLEENGFTDLPAYYDTELAASIEYGASALPTTVVVNGDGEIVSISAGMIDPVLLRGTLDQMV